MSVIISLIILGVGSKINGDVDVHMSQLGRSVLVYYINAIAGIYIIMQISIWLERYSHCAKNFLQKIGTKTLGIMGIHASIIFVLSMLISLGNLWGNIVIFIITVTISYIVAVVYDWLYNKLFENL